MTKQGLLFFAAVVTICIVAVFFFHSPRSQPVQAQPAQAPLRGPINRFQIVSFTLQQKETSGAYILDTQTGDVIQVVGKNAPESISSVARRQPKN